MQTGVVGGQSASSEQVSSTHALLLHAKPAGHVLTSLTPIAEHCSAVTQQTSSLCLVQPALITSTSKRNFIDASRMNDVAAALLGQRRYPSIGSFSGYGFKATVWRPQPGGNTGYHCKLESMVVHREDPFAVDSIS